MFERLLDTRDPPFGGPLGSDWSVSVPVDYNDPATPTVDVNSHITALMVNIPAVRPTKPGYLTSWDGGPVVPATSTLNFAPGTVTPNMAVVPVGPWVDFGTPQHGQGPGCGERDRHRRGQWQPVQRLQQRGLHQRRG